MRKYEGETRRTEHQDVLICRNSLGHTGGRRWRKPG